MISPAFTQLYDIVEANLVSSLPKVEADAEVLGRAMEYSLTAGGKRIRPVLILACCRMSGGRIEDALKFSAAAEFIQTYSLIHDDLPAMDNDDFRRGLPTNHKMFGEDVAILAGDGLLSAAWEVIAEDMASCAADPQMLANKAKAAYDLAAGTGVRGMVAGQIADIGSEHCLCSPEKLDFIHRNKTAAFIKACVLAGAHIGGADGALIGKLSEYGDCVGLAFQIIDDIQDVIGDPDKRGKKTGGDAENEKSTYPALYGLEQSQKKADELLEKARGILRELPKEEVLSDLVEYLQKMVR